jgi:hypothetical protein
MRGIRLIALALVGWYVWDRFKASGSEPRGIRADVPNNLNPANASGSVGLEDLANAYGGFPPSTPVVYLDSEGGARETTAGQLSQAFTAAVTMQDTGFLPTPSAEPVLAHGTGAMPGRDYLL